MFVNAPIVARTMLLGFVEPILLARISCTPSTSRTAKVVKGGRVFGFAVLVVIGDGKGKVGYGRGKAREVPIAIQKAMDQARKNMTYIPLAGTTIHHEISWNYGASRVFMKPL